MMQAQAAHAVNLSLTSRNWLIGMYIVEYEQHGQDRAQYGESLLKNLASQLRTRGLGERRLYEFRQLYMVYPQLAEEVINHISLNISTKKLRSASAKLALPISDDEILRAASAISANSHTEAWQTPSDRLFNRLSASHLITLSNISEPLQRAFYEQETIRGCWTTRDLDRQISSLYYERMGLSKDKNALQKYVEKGAKQLRPRDILHEPIALEFLGLQEQAAFTETKLETAILNHLQYFLLEMGNGFCFEARQKRIMVDQDYFKADLVFYHRILKCHVIIDLKIDRFRHEYASQLNLYLNYFRHEVMQEDDNPPVGLLLCAGYGETTVRYATEGLENLFVSKYKLQLPSEDDIRQYLLDNISEDDYKKEN